MRVNTRTRLFTTFICLALVSGCSTLGGQVANPLSTAQTVEQKAFVIYAEFVTAEEIGLSLMQDPAVSVDLKRKIQSADKIAKPLMDNLVTVTLEVQRARMLLADSETLDAKLAALSIALARAGPAVQNLLNLTKQGEN